MVCMLVLIYTYIIIEVNSKSIVNKIKIKVYKISKIGQYVQGSLEIFGTKGSYFNTRSSSNFVKLIYEIMMANKHMTYLIISITAIYGLLY